MSDDLRNGWAVRRADQCNSTESGKWTWGKWVYCCPKGMEAHTDLDDNKQCRIGSPPDDFPNQCADPTLVLWKDSKAGYFCCEVDLIGFLNENSWKGCVDTDEFNEGQKNDTMTRADQLGQPTVTMTSTSTSSAASQASATTTTSAPSSTLDSSKSQDSSSSTNIGAIAGGVVGGFFGALLIVGVIWFFNRRRRSAAAAKSNSENTAFNAAGQPPVPGNFVAVPGNNSSSWTGSYSTTTSTQQELPGNMPAPHELQGNRSESKP